MGEREEGGRNKERREGGREGGGWEEQGEERGRERGRRVGGTRRGEREGEREGERVGGTRRGARLGTVQSHSLVINTDLNYGGSEKGCGTLPPLQHNIHITQSLHVPDELYTL